MLTGSSLKVCGGGVVQDIVGSCPGYVVCKPALVISLDQADQQCMPVNNANRAMALAHMLHRISYFVTQILLLFYLSVNGWLFYSLPQYF